MTTTTSPAQFQGNNRHSVHVFLPNRRKAIVSYRVRCKGRGEARFFSSLCPVFCMNGRHTGEQTSHPPLKDQSACGVHDLLQWPQQLGWGAVQRQSKGTLTGLTEPSTGHLFPVSEELQNGNVCTHCVLPTQKEAKHQSSRVRKELLSSPTSDDCQKTKPI